MLYGSIDPQTYCLRQISQGRLQKDGKLLTNSESELGVYTSFDYVSGANFVRIKFLAENQLWETTLDLAQMDYDRFTTQLLVCRQEAVMKSCRGYRSSLV